MVGDLDDDGTKRTSSDISEENSVSALISSTVDTSGGLDGLRINAGTWAR